MVSRIDAMRNRLSLPKGVKGMTEEQQAQEAKDCQPGADVADQLLSGKRRKAIQTSVGRLLSSSTSRR